MTTPAITDLLIKCAIVENIAKNFPEGSAEQQALAAAAHAMQYVSHAETQAKFRAWLADWTQPLTALQVLNAKLAGIDDLPHELMDETMREVEQLMERLRTKRT